MAKFNVIQCPVCTNKNFSPFLTCSDFFISKETFQIKKCNTCGFKITEDVEDEENIGLYYQSEEYISHSDTSQGLVNSIYHNVRKYMLRKKRTLVEKVSPVRKGKILDIGTGTGFFINEMKQSGWTTTATEENSGARQFSKKKFDLNIYPAKQLFFFKENMFDVITLWHVLEHIHSLKENMEAYYKTLKKEGKLIIAVPNNSSYDAKHYRKFWAAYDVPRHIWHFEPAQMKLLGEKSGFIITGIRRMPFDSFYISMLSEKYKKSQFSFIKGMFHGTISWVTSLFKPSRSSSIIYIFEKA